MTGIRTKHLTPSSNSMMMNYYSLFYGALSLVSIVVYLGLLVFLFTRYSKYPKPTALALVAMGAMLLLGVFQMVVPMLLSRFFQTEQFLMANLVSNFFTTIGHLASIGMLIWAIYAGRGQIPPNPPVGRSTLSAENPYGPPVNE